MPEKLNLYNLCLDDYVAKYQDFPKPGIVFYDISPALADVDCLRRLISRLAELAAPMAPDVILGIDARGFLFATPLALQLGTGAVIARKSGKLPGETYSATYALEYGKAKLTLQKDIDLKGKRVVLVDDLIATGGTMSAACALVEKAGGLPVGAVCAIELVGLSATDHLSCHLASIQQYEA